jgi:uncharacterized protein Yka (UPF0111/DUF47 family)
MLGKLLPRKTEFFALFSRHAELCLDGARMLRELLQKPVGAEERATQIRMVEHDADSVCQRTMEALHATFVTPLERGDIHLLSSRLDDIMDHIEATASRLWLYEIERVTPEALEMGENLVRAAEAVKVSVDALGQGMDPTRMRELCGKIKQVEKENDRVLRRATARLFKEQQDARELIKWKEIYEDLEGAVDRCEDVGNIIEGVVIENS